MVGMIPIKEAALHWNITERRISTLCKDGKIEGAVKHGRRWLIPSDAQKPADSRIKSGAYRKAKRSEKLPLPIGISDYCLASTEYYYVDKTMMIKDFIDERPMVTLFTRPRRFGKTLNMDMLRTFFEKTEKDTSVYFRDKEIWKCGKKYQEYQGKYPVIFLTFKDVKFTTWEEIFDAVKEIFAKETRRHTELRTSDKCDEYDKQMYERLAEGTVSEVELSAALLSLSDMLHKHYGIAPIIIIDEYDTPIQQGYMQGFYDEVVLFMRNLFSGGLKDNKHLSFGFLTGILRVAKESIFSGLNNLKVNSVLDDRYDKYFGFTSDEVMEMSRYYSAEDKFDEICDWYDGYCFGSTDIFNPWSVLNYFNNRCQAGAYWQSTGSNDIIGEILSCVDEDTNEKLVKLLGGESVVSAIDTGVIYPQIKNNPSSVFSFLLVAGYLKSVECHRGVISDYMCRVAIPNKEISFVYRKEILQKLEYMLTPSAVTAIQEALFMGDSALLQKHLENLLLRSASCFDTVGENFYQGLMLGLTAAFEPYKPQSNKESGEGRYDIQLKPKRKNLPGIIIELKAQKNCSGDALKELAKAALNQINEKKYDTELTTDGVTNIIKFGVAFSGKNVAVIVG
ncbi:MAG: AAA family ATPase [Eubacterium sp.]|nr:AAA family ATPase [Eubacterium sp.]